MYKVEKNCKFLKKEIVNFQNKYNEINCELNVTKS